MKGAVSFYSEGVRLAGDGYHPEGVRPGWMRSVPRPDEWHDLLDRDRLRRALEASRRP
jgi:hypothetical protein